MDKHKLICEINLMKTNEIFPTACGFSSIIPGVKNSNIIPNFQGGWTWKKPKKQINKNTTKYDLWRILGNLGTL